MKYILVNLFGLYLSLIALTTNTSLIYLERNDVTLILDKITLSYVLRLFCLQFTHFEFSRLLCYVYFYFQNMVFDIQHGISI